MPVTKVYHPQDYDYAMTTDARGRNSYSVRWVAETSNLAASPKEVVSQAKATDQGFDSPLPAFWATYSFQGETDTHAYLKGNLRAFKPNPEHFPGIWHIDGTYEPLEPGQTAGDANTDPLARPVRRRWANQPYSRIVTEDKDGNPLLNGAGREFTEPPEEQGNYPVLELSWNVADSDAVAVFNSTYQFSVNTNAITTAGTSWPARHVRIDAATSSELQTEGTTSFYTLSVRLIFNWEPWDLRTLNQGFMIKDTEVGSPTEGQLGRAVDFDGRPEPEPVLLETDGSRLAEGQVGNFITTRRRREVSYAGLSIS